MIKKEEAAKQFMAEEKARFLLLEQEAARLESLAQERAKQRDEENRIQNQLFMLEQENKQRLANLQRIAQPAPVEDKTVTIVDAGHPMAAFLTKRDVDGVAIETATAAQPVEEISYAQHTAVQAKLDAERKVVMPAQGPRLSVDGNTLAAFTKLFKDETQEQCNSELAISLLKDFDESRTFAALRSVAAQHRVTRLSVQGIVSSMRMMLEDTAEIPTPVPVVVQGETVSCPRCGMQIDPKASYHGNPLCVVSPRNARSAGVISAKQCEELEAQRQPI